MFRSCYRRVSASWRCFEFIQTDYLMMNSDANMLLVWTYDWYKFTTFSGKLLQSIFHNFCQMATHQRYTYYYKKRYTVLIINLYIFHTLKIEMLQKYTFFNDHFIHLMFLWALNEIVQKFDVWYDYFTSYVKNIDDKAIIIAY